LEETAPFNSTLSLPPFAGTQEYALFVDFNPTHISASDVRTFSSAIFHWHEGKNLNTGILVFLIYETGIPVLIPVCQKQTFFSISFDES
jgi:hypothetical protein